MRFVRISRESGITSGEGRHLNDVLFILRHALSYLQTNVRPDRGKVMNYIQNMKVMYWGANPVSFDLNQLLSIMSFHSNRKISLAAQSALKNLRLAFGMVGRDHSHMHVLAGKLKHAPEEWSEDVERIINTSRVLSMEKIDLAIQGLQELTEAIVPLDVELEDDPIGLDGMDL